MTGTTGTDVFDADVATTVRAAAARSSGFRRRLEVAGLRADDLADVEALARLPVLTKDDLLEQQQADPPFAGYLADDADVVRVFQSPGPLYEPEVAGSDAWRWAPALRAAGFSGEDRVLVAFGYHLSPAGAMFESACTAIGATTLPAGTGNKDLQVRACADLGVTAYIGPPSYLKALLEAAEDGGTELAIERAFVSAEPLPPSLRAWLNERVPVVRQGYGTAETGHLASECPEEVGLHVADDCLVQVCDLTSGEPVPPGQEGQVVATLFEPAYPIVRFGTGDLSRWLDEPCPCGSEAPRLAGWLGRVGDAVKVRGMFLHPRQVATVMAGITGVEAWQLVIDRVDHRDVLTARVVTGSAPEDVAAALRDGLRFTVEVEVTDDLPADADPIRDVRTWD